MKRSFVMLFGLVLMSVATVGCTRTAAALETEALDNVLKVWTDCYNKHDAKALANLYAEDADLRSDGGDLVEGRAAIEKHWAEAFAKDPQIKTRQEAIHRRVVAPGVVVEDGKWEASGHTDKESLAGPKKGFWVAVLVKQGGNWLLASDRGFSPIPKPVAKK